MGRREFACLALMMLMMAGLRSEAAISCGQVVLALIPCVNYVRMGGSVPPACCAGVKQVADAAKANVDLQAACECTKQMAASIPGLQYDLVNSIPGKCGISLPCKISPSVNCTE